MILKETQLTSYGKLELWTDADGKRVVGKQMIFLDAAGKQTRSEWVPFNLPSNNPRPKKIPLPTLSKNGETLFNTEEYRIRRF